MEGFIGNMTRIGYARVSTVDQHLDLQRNALRLAGCNRIFEDHGVSGSNEQRGGLSSMLKALRRGDILVVWRLDRLGRSIIHLISMVESLKRRGIGLVSLTESIDTSSAGGQLIFHILAALAEFEKSLIRERTIAGIAAAKARGKLPGRRPALTEVQCMEIRATLNSGVSLREVARNYNVHPRTVLRGISRLARSQPQARGETISG
ncbi:recombinase family protein [Agrobacterium radiobacter]|uniref:recombinase family protein n=1 Tax=Agrobacterium radiobacter TaxID=362 RepID=UPI000DD6CE0E|nr:recombinase family protein [Agrobacterium radiobacter]MBB4406406.1 DNA invertase Pin-like site-specific DNA recombinase [Agrobacterium radiobacter]MBB4450185.1 DNA invertase Pin-like site-specific DNA recombinase [Agrobacterium radiobacter]